MNKKWKKEEGAVIVVAVFVTLALVVVGSLASMLTHIELDISRNDRLGKEAFFVADAGVPISTEVIEDIIFNEEIPSYSGFNFNSNFLNEVRNYYEDDSNLNDRNSDTPDSDPDIETTVLNKALTIDIDWRMRKAGAGGSLLFAMGYEGIGADRSHGGVKIFYNIDTKGEVSGNTTAEIESVYLYQ